MVVFGFPNSFLHTTERDFFVCRRAVGCFHMSVGSHFAALHIVFLANLLRGTETVCTLARVLGSILFILDMSGVTGCKNDKTEKRDSNLQCKLEKEDSKGPTKRRWVFKNMTDLEKT